MPGGLAGDLLRGGAGQRPLHAEEPGRPLPRDRHGSDESTVFLSRKEAGRSRRPRSRESATKDETRASRSRACSGSPVPITMPTYVSKPLAPRTVRTIDLSGPPVAPADRPQMPVTADAPEPVAPVAPRLRATIQSRGRLRVADGKVCVLIGPEPVRGAMAQLVARLVRNEKVRGSIPLAPPISKPGLTRSDDGSSC